MGDVLTDKERSEWLSQIEVLRAEVSRLQAEVDRLTKERDAYKHDFDVELDGNIALRRKHGARDGETMWCFFERVVGERDAALARAEKAEAERDEAEKQRKIAVTLFNAGLHTTSRDLAPVVEERDVLRARVDELDELCEAAEAREAGLRVALADLIPCADLGKCGCKAFHEQADGSWKPTGKACNCEACRATAAVSASTAPCAPCPNCERLEDHLRGCREEREAAEHLLAAAEAREAGLRSALVGDESCWQAWKAFAEEGTDAAEKFLRSVCIDEGIMNEDGGRVVRAALAAATAKEPPPMVACESCARFLTHSGTCAGTIAEGCRDYYPAAAGCPPAKEVPPCR